LALRSGTRKLIAGLDAIAAIPASVPNSWGMLVSGLPDLGSDGCVSDRPVQSSAHSFNLFNTRDLVLEFVEQVLLEASNRQSDTSLSPPICHVPAVNSRP
jgi:hypothetical protein